MHPLERAPGSPLDIVHGNCQAGSIRRLLESAGATALRVPPVHELTTEDAHRLHSFVASADALVTQPIADDYRGLPVGSRELAALLPAGARVVRVPVLRFAAPFALQVTVRPSFASSIDPPIVPYHDLRTAIVASEQSRAASLTGAARARFDELGARLDEAAVLRLREASIEALRSREIAHDTVSVAHLLARMSLGQRTHHTLNHPVNAFFLAAVEPVIDALGGLPGTPEAPDFEMLGGIRAAVEPACARALGIEEGPWIVDSLEVSTHDIADAQLRWYRENPRFVEAALTRHHDTIELLGIAR